MPPRVPVHSLHAGVEAASTLACSSSTGTASTIRAFSSTPSCQRSTLLRRKMRDWFKAEGRQYKRHTPDAGPQYLGRGPQVFPNNPAFQSTPVLSEEARELIWDKIMRQGESIKAVSAELSVDMRRVAAVVRLKEVEKDWVSKGIPLARPYSKAILEMLPQTRFRDGAKAFHEPINDLHVHSYTMQQLFLPTSESRHFTREDAAKAFHDKLLSADKRVPHPELIKMHREVLQGASETESYDKFKEQAAKSERKIAAREMYKAQKAEERTTRVDSGRFEFRFKDVNVDNVGRDGRSRRGTGWRYGVPFYDRKRGQVKIPTSVG